MELESEQFLKLLTDALRAGPGSPEWHQVVQQLRAQGPEAEQYRRLCEAREQLESGKGYRQVRAGPGFTRKLMEGVEKELIGTPTPISTANIIAVASAVAMLAILSVVAWFLVPSGSAPRAAIGDLANTYFGDLIVSEDFQGPLSSEWRKIGSLPLDTEAGLRPLAATGAKGEYRGGGLVLDDPMPAVQSFEVEVSLRLGPPTDDVVAQVFVTDDPQFSEDRATSPHELVWSLQGMRMKVVRPNGRGEGLSDRPRDLREPLVVRIRMNQSLAIVEAGGKRLWAGRHQLSDSAPRHIGVRFLRRSGGGDKQEPVVVQSIRVQRPQK